MIFSIPFVVLSVVTGFVRLVFTLFIESIVVIYAILSRDEYANSIRWSIAGGLLEMIHLLWSSWQIVPRASKITMSAVMIASFIALFVSSILMALVSRADLMGKSGTARSLTPQLISMDPSFWTTYLKPESTMEETLTGMLNDTRRNPLSNPRTLYTPRTFPYEASCLESTAFVLNNSTERIYMPSNTIKCKGYIMHLLAPSFNWNLLNATVRQLDSSTGMVVTPVTLSDRFNVIETIEPTIMATDSKLMCSRITTAADRVASLSLKFPKDGILALPKTYATKCQYGEDKSLVLSATFIQFAVNNVQDFGKVTASMLDNPAFLPLIAPMNTAIDQGIFTRTKNSTMAFFIKIPSSASDVDFFVCVSEYRTKQGNAGLICTYILTSFTLVKPQAMDPTISADVNRKPRPINSLNATNQLEFIVRHLPRTAKSQGTQNTAPLFSAEHLSQATVDATRYLASLGHNVHIYKNLGSTADDLYILYDTVELKDAYEISTTAFIIICALTALFVLVWYFTGRFCSAHYTNSLYMAIHQELSSKNKSVPMLMFCTHDPIAFDGNQVVPGSREDLSVDQVEPFSQEHSVDSPSEDCGDKPKKQQKWRLRTTSQKNIDQSSPRKPWSITIARPVEDYTVPTIIQTGPDSTNISMSLQAAEPQPHINIDQSNAPPIPRHSRPRQFPHNSLSTPSTQ